LTFAVGGETREPAYSPFEFGTGDKELTLAVAASLKQAEAQLRLDEVDL
jgi:hypothetical protein